MADARSIRCSECHCVFRSDERAPYVGYDHLLDEHRALLLGGGIDTVTLRPQAAKPPPPSKEPAMGTCNPCGNNDHRP